MTERRRSPSGREHVEPGDRVAFIGPVHGHTYLGTVVELQPPAGNYYMAAVRWDDGERGPPNPIELNRIQRWKL